ncbi:hypothetical protein [Spirosoma lituiforme]
MNTKYLLSFLCSPIRLPLQRQTINARFALHSLFRYTPGFGRAFALYGLILVALRQ